MNKKVVTVSGVLGVLAGGAALIFWLLAPGANLALQPRDKTVVAQGKTIYAAQCASCHGLQLKGQPNWRQRQSNGKLPAPPHDDSGHTWHHSDALLIDLTKRGTAAIAGAGYQSDMPAFSDILTDSEIVAVLSYVKSTWPEKIRKRHDQMNRPRE